MKIHTIQHNNLQEFEKQLNLFDANNKVKATQTHVTVLGTSNMIYTAFVYYEDK